MNEVVVVSAVRTAIGSIGGTLKQVLPETLLQTVIVGAMKQAGLEADVLDEVIMGQTKQTTDAPNIARVAALMAGVPETVPAYTVHRQCASGMQAMVNAWQQIQCGYSTAVVAGGVESMSTAPFYIRNARFGVGSGNTVFIDPNVESQPKSQPAAIYGNFNMIQTADTVAQQFGVSRVEQDEFALASQLKAVQAIDSGRFQAEIVPLVLPQRKGEPIVFTVDEYPKRSTSQAQLAKLKPIFAEGTVTAGNASGRNDGAAALLIMDRAKAMALGLTPLVRIMGAAASGVDPRIMGIAPVSATQKLLQQLGMTISDFGLFEINEAFAAQAVACARQLAIDPSKLNVNGGAIALGHPLGCSGARIATTLIHELKRRNERYGLASICIAGGLGMAIAFENID